MEEVIAPYRYPNHNETLTCDGEEIELNAEETEEIELDVEELEELIAPGKKMAGKAYGWRRKKTSIF